MPKAAPSLAGYARSMHENKVALVTGANKGIGHAIASALAAHGLTVLVGARDAARGEAAAQRIAGNARVCPLDVTREESIAAAAKRIESEFGRLDVLVNNAGIATFGAPSTTRLEDVRAVFETNVFGVIAVTQAMLPLLRAARAARIVNVSTRLGSLSAITDRAFPMRGIGGVAYGPSKSTLNAITVAFALELADTNIKVNAACPGHTATDLNGHTGARTVDEAAKHPVRLALLGDDGPTGTFSNDAGTIPW
jgi:NAD(P)-dependent dehydrogenase (short-subunit alcohol dehydrogenase family)